MTTIQEVSLIQVAMPYPEVVLPTISGLHLSPLTTCTKESHMMFVDFINLYTDNPTGNNESHVGITHWRKE
jgi:hypothetical protein